MGKKLVFLQVVFFVLAGAEGYCQSMPGIKLGATFSYPQASNSSAAAATSYSFLRYNDFRGRGGLLIGIFVPVALSEKLYLRPSAEIAFRSIKAQATGTYGSYKTSRPVNYLDIPVPVTYVTDINGYKLFIGAGPSVSILLNDAYHFLRLTNTTDFGVNGLVALESKIGFSVNLNYIHGFNSLDADYKLKNRFLNLSLGYLF